MSKYLFMSKKLNVEEFINKCKMSHDTKYDYSLITEDNFGGSHSKVDILCPLHGKFTQMARLHMNGSECPKCSYTKRMSEYKNSLEEFVKKAINIHGSKYDYSKVKYINSHAKICIICPVHGEFWQTPNDHLSRRGCPRCNDSHLETIISNELSLNGILFERNKHFKWLKKLELDFYLPEYNIGIECQGKQHFGVGGWSKNYDFKKQYLTDTIKNRLCEENGIKIFYYGEIKYAELANQIKLYNKDNLFFKLEEIFNKIK